MTEWKRHEITLGTGSFTPITDTGDIAVYRSGDQLGVVDPDGVTTPIATDVADRFAGTFACWQLREDTAAQTPARILSISAG